MNTDGNKNTKKITKVTKQTNTKKVDEIFGFFSVTIDEYQQMKSNMFGGSGLINIYLSNKQNYMNLKRVI